MEIRDQNLRVGCPTAEIGSYVDGELPAERTLEIETHFASCPSCADELNLQKYFLSALNSSFGDETPIELPPDFTKRIVTNAESTVSGLRKPSERLNALLVCAALVLIALFALGTEAFGPAGAFLEKVAAVFGFVGRLAFSFLVGVGVVLRTLSGQFHVPAVIAFLFVGAAAYLAFRFSRALLPFRRT